MDDYFKIYRTILDHWIYQDSDYLKIWITMLSKGQYIKGQRTGMYNKIKFTLSYGQFIFGRKQWSKDLNIGEQKIRTCVNKLIKDEMIVNVIATSKFTIYEIKNYAKFNLQSNHQDEHEETEEIQEVESSGNQQSNHQVIHLVTTTQPPSNHQVTTNEESKKANKVKKINSILSAEQTPYEEIKNLFNQICVTLPKVKTITKTRKDTLNIRWKSNADIRFFEDLFKMVDESDFLSGRSGKWSACCFDWILKPSNMQKILEGNYENKKATNSNGWEMQDVK